MYLSLAAILLTNFMAMRLPRELPKSSGLDAVLGSEAAACGDSSSREADSRPCDTERVPSFRLSLTGRDPMLLRALQPPHHYVAALALSHNFVNQHMSGHAVTYVPASARQSDLLCNAILRLQPRSQHSRN